MEQTLAKEDAGVGHVSVTVMEGIMFSLMDLVWNHKSFFIGGLFGFFAGLIVAQEIYP